MDDKKSIEFDDLRRFLKVLDAIPNEIVIPEFDPPDFVMDIEGKKISVEHTRIIFKDKKKVEEYKKSIVKGAERLFKSTYDDIIDVTVVFNNILPKGGKMKETYERELNSIVESNFKVNAVTKIDTVLPVPFRQDGIFKRVRISRLLESGYWQSGIEKYRCIVDEKWLLLISNEGHESSARRYDFIDFDYSESKFDRIFVFKKTHNEIVEIK